MWLLQVVCTVYPLTDVTQFAVVAIGAGVGVVSILVLWTIRLYDADDSAISVQIVNLGHV